MKWQDQSPVWTPLPPERLPDSVATQLGNQSRVGVEAAVVDTVRKHLGNAAHEQGGLLIGETYVLADGRLFIRVVEAIAATEFEASSISLRMQAAVWSQARERLTAGRLIVGWYHSHPDLGAFFSATDRRTQSAFFAHDYSLGWVIDPIRHEQAWFVGADSDELQAGQICWLLAQAPSLS